MTTPVKGAAPYPVTRTFDAPLLDVRPESAFRLAHHPVSANIPLEELSARVHELPPRTVSLQITDADPQRARTAADFLRKRGHPVALVPLERNDLKATGPSRVRLWRPNPFLPEALEAIRVADRRRPALMRRAMDVACGTGRDAVYLALEGYDVLAVDLLPDALHRAQDLATRSGVHLHTRAMDLERGAALPPGTFDLVCVFRYLHRPLFPALQQAVARGGYLVYETFHEQTLATPHPPRSPAHLLKTGELPAAFPGFEPLITRDAVEREGRYFSHLLARKR